MHFRNFFLKLFFCIFIGRLFMHFQFSHGWAFQFPHSISQWILFVLPDFQKYWLIVSAFFILNLILFCDLFSWWENPSLDRTFQSIHFVLFHSDSFDLLSMSTCDSLALNDEKCRVLPRLTTKKVSRTVFYPSFDHWRLFPTWNNKASSFIFGFMRACVWFISRIYEPIKH